MNSKLRPRSRLASVAMVAALAAAFAASAPAVRAQGSQSGQGSKLDDATIVAIFDAANTADIETGSLAASRAQNKEVRQLGTMFAHDHRVVRQQGRDLAKQLHVTPTPPKNDDSAKQHLAAMRALRAKHGREFDKAFLEHEIAYHQAVIDAVQSTLMPAIQNDSLKALVQRVAPAFQAHMIAAQNLHKKLFGGAAN